MKHAKLVAGLITVCMLAACQQSGPYSASANKPSTPAIGATALNTNHANANPANANPAAPVANAAPVPVGGTLLGPALNNSIGRFMDNSDRAAYDAVAQHILETGQPGQSMSWRNPQTGHSGTVTAQNYSQNSSGQYCRDYTQTVVVDNQKQDGNGRACRMPDATWQLVQ